MTTLICRRRFCCSRLICFPRILSIEPRFLRPAVAVLSNLVSAFVLLVVIFFTGSEVEQRRVKHLPGTSSFYKTSNVCALILPPQYGEIFNNQSVTLRNFTVKNVTNITALQANIKGTRSSSSDRLPPIVNRTYSSPNVFQKEHNSTIMAHCGDCGACSNPRDIAIYAATRNTLLHTSTGCAKHGLVGGRKAANLCMVTKVGFSPSCNDCWVENIMCDLRECIFSCLWHRTVDKLFRRDGSGGGANHTDHKLNACTLCDEKRCGPAFIKCAGVNRRRAGILSDISRENSQVCKLPEPEWWQSPILLAYYDATQPPPSSRAHRWPFRG